MAQKVLLLDIDGVLLKDKLLLHNVTENVVQYVQKHAPIKNLDTLQARHLNKLLYKSHGHTLRGMRIAFPNNAEEYTNSCFAKEVYNKQLLSNLLKHIDSSDEFKLLHETFQPIIDRCNEKNIPIHILSNAPLEWCCPIFCAFNISHMVISQDTFFHSNHLYFNNSLLKPDVELYSLIFQKLQQKHNFQNNKGAIECIFVDDSPINLLPILSIGGWTPIQFKSQNDNASSESMNYIKHISSLSDVKLYL